ncbi:MAG: hypothetical protein ABIP64_03295, partial [Burkholderiales bacterium]
MISAGEWNGDLVAASTVQCGLMFEASGSPATALQVMRHGTSHDPAEKDLIPDGWFEAWGNATFETDAWGMQQNPPVLRAPNGVVYDIQNYWAAG